MAVPQLQLANLGEIYAQNQARQASIDNVMLQQQSALEQRQAQQAAAQREAAIRQAIAGGVNPSTQEGLGQLLQAGLPLEQFQSGMKSIGDIELAKARGQAAQAQGQSAMMRGQAAQQTANTRSWQAQQQIGLNRAQEARMVASAKKEWGKVGFDMAVKLSQGLTQIPEEQRPAAYQALKSQYGELAPQLFEDEEYTPEMGQMAQVLAKASEKTSTGKPVAVIDPDSGESIYVSPQDAIGKKAASGGADFKSEMQLRKEFNQQQSEYKDVSAAYAKINQLSKSNSPASQISLLYNYMKLNDPGSVVRESEFEVAASAGSYGDKMQNAVTRLTGGQRLTQSQVNDFVGAANSLYQSQREKFTQSKNYYGTLAQQYNLNPERVTFDPDASNAPLSQPASTTGGQGGVDDLLNRYAPQ
jgi:hypothetical protein